MAPGRPVARLMADLQGVPMRALLLTLAAATTGVAPLTAAAQDVLAGAPIDLSVTVYRAPERAGSQLDLDDLQGFALITETRTLSLPAGESRVRFPGVADGIQPPTAILAGLPATLLEKNQDARVLSPAALVAAAMGRSVTLVRTDLKTGRTSRVAGTLRADNQDVVFESAEGVEALRCSGLPETFEFSSTGDLAPTPTLSVAVRSERPVSAQVRLSYLAWSFDWTATYTAMLSADASTMELGAWVTLANGNGVSFPAAHVQIVAGRLNREIEEEVEVLDLAALGPVRVLCWPTGTTSDFPRPGVAGRPFARAIGGAEPVEEEQLGDLKLYRVPRRTSVDSRQMKQVRLLEAHAVPVELIYSIELKANEDTDVLAKRTLRTKNDTAHHLGLPLPAGTVETFTAGGDIPLLLAEAPLRDIALNEELEMGIGDAPDVQVRAVTERTTIDPGRVTELPLLHGVVHLRSAVVDRASRIEISNARRTAVTFEARLQLPEGTQLIGADPAPIMRNGRPVLRLRVPAASRATVRYETEHTTRRVRRDMHP
jgi:hypothetical protein